MANVILLQKGDLKQSDFTNDNSNNAQGIGIRISQQYGNLLERRSDGLYYGIEAPPDLANLYVSNDGDDNASGTRANPLRTLEAALNRIPNAPQFFTIHLHEGHSFELHTKHHKDLAKIKLRQYGPQTDSTYPDSGFGNLYYRGYVAESLPRPIINVYTHVTPNSVRRAAIVATKIETYGVHFKIYGTPPEHDDGTKGGDIDGVLATRNGSVDFIGSIFEVINAGKSVGNQAGAYRNDVYFRGDLTWTHSKLIPADLSTTKINNQYSSLISPYYTTKVVVHDVEAYSVVDGSGVRKDAVLTSTNTSKSYFSIGKNVHVNYNQQSRIVYGIAFQWDVLATSGL